VTEELIVAWQDELFRMDIVGYWSNAGRVYGIFKNFDCHNKTGINDDGTPIRHRRKTPIEPQELVTFSDALKHLPTSCNIFTNPNPNPTPNPINNPEPPKAGLKNKGLGLKDFSLLGDAVRRVIGIDEPFPFAGRLLKKYRPEIIMYGLLRVRNRVMNGPEPLRDHKAFLVELLQNRTAVPSVVEGGDDISFREEYTIKDWHDKIFGGVKKRDVRGGDLTSVGDAMPPRVWKPEGVE
jgi:hypothetical protein